MSEGARVPVVLLVEDSPADREIFQRAFRNEGTPIDLRTVYDGENALDYLFRRGRYAEPELSPRPDLVLLDLNLPNLSGRELLHLIRSYPELKHIPVVVLTTTHSPADVLDSYRMGANSFLTKPASFADVVETIRQTCRFWFDTATLPPNS